MADAIPPMLLEDIRRRFTFHEQSRGLALVIEAVNTKRRYNLLYIYFYLWRKAPECLRNNVARRNWSIQFNFNLFRGNWSEQLTSSFVHCLMSSYPLWT